MSSIAKARISITLMQSINNLLNQLSEQSGISKSQIIEKATQKYLLESLDRDSKKLAGMSFDDLPSENEWLSISSDI